MSQSSGQPASGGDDLATLRAQFDEEVRVADIVVSDADREPLFGMWAAHRTVRARLGATEVALEEEPSFTQKPAQPGAGITLRDDTTIDSFGLGSGRAS
ncbi:MAG: hypothetical protein U0893_19060 [Chloroflexota bacterium]